MHTKLLPLQQASVEDLFLLAYVYIDDYLKAAVYSGLFTLPNEPHQKATYAELMTIALVGEWLGGIARKVVPASTDHLPPSVPAFAG